jgi:DNA-directed RNA polymerase subunit RPC12/RpoP
VLGLKVYSNDMITCPACGSKVTFMVKRDIGTIRCKHKCTVYYDNGSEKVGIWKIIPLEEHNAMKEELKRENEKDGACNGKIQAKV